VQTLGEAFMLESATRAAGRALGYDGWPFYLAGRAGVLGAAGPEIVTSVVAFFPPSFIEAQWKIALDAGPLPRAVAAYLAQCHRWGNEHLRNAPGLDRLCALAEKVISAAPIAGRPLFAGWAALPLPQGPDRCATRAAQLMQVLREHRGGAHMLAIAAAGLPPLTAVLADPASGIDVARYFRWPPPYAEPTAHEIAIRAEAERTTNALVGADLDVLSATERNELTDLLTAAHQHAFAHPIRMHDTRQHQFEEGSHGSTSPSSAVHLRDRDPEGAGRGRRLE